MSVQAIQAHVTAVQVPYLLHFTRAVNLPSILTHGLYPISRAHEIGATPQVNDQYRWDGHRDGTSLSIGFPNCQMLYKYRMAEPAVDWAILVIHPAAMWMKGCAFCRHNAADGRISGQPLANLMTPEAFVGMYAEIDGVASREEQKLKPFDPTDVQAEVLVFDVIEPQFIVGVIFEKTAIRDVHLPQMAERKNYVHANNKGMFANRKYARNWG